MEKEKLFGAIFKKNIDGLHFLHDVALVDYDSDSKVIKTGRYKYAKLNQLNIITNDPDEFILGYCKVNIADYDANKNSIILFDQNYIDKLKERYEVIIKDDVSAYTFLANNLSKIYLYTGEDNELYTKKGESVEYYSKSDMEKMLENYYYKNLSDENIELTDLDGEENNELDSQNDSLEEVLSSVFGYPVKVKTLTLEDVLKKQQEKENKHINEEEKEVNFENDIDTKKIISNTSKKLIGQEKTIRTIVNQIYNNQKIIDELSKAEDFDYVELDSRKTSILVDGETGTGKTAILKDVAKQLGLPIKIVSSTSFSETGYVGASVTDILQDLLRQTNGNLEKAERGIIVFDEIDKLASGKDNMIGKDMREEVQNELLTFIGGGEYEVYNRNFMFPQVINFNTSKNTFILLGAFTDLREDKIKETEKEHQGIGFSSSNNQEYQKEYLITSDDYVKYGIKREFFGRVKVLTSTKSYNLEDCKEILLKSTISPLLNFEKNVKMYGYPGIEYDEEFLNAVAEEGMKMKTGARGLQTVMAGIQNNMLDALINCEFDKDKPIRLTASMVKDYKKTFVRKY